MMRRTAVIFDMDGTLVNVSSIRHFVKSTPRDFVEFHSQSINCPPHDDVVDAAHKAVEDGHEVIVVTARGEMWRSLTSVWLALHNVPSDALLMRSGKDNRSDVEVKRDILAMIRQTRDVVHAFDDNPNVIALWVENGIPTTVVPGWDL